MERDLNFKSPRPANINVAEPHFNDERTIQTARPVVPLNVFSRILTRRRVGLAGAFVLAALLGAGTALAIIRLRQPVTTLTEASEKEESNQPVAEAAPPETEPTSPVSDLETTEPTPARPQARSSRRPRTVQPERSASTVTIAIEPGDSRPQARLVDEWQERRQRRVIRPERQNNHHERDLFRIREIFEGPRPE